MTYIQRIYRYIFLISKFNVIEHRKGNLKMNELIKINCENADRPTVSGRELHKALEVKTAYKVWQGRRDVAR